MRLLTLSLVFGVVFGLVGPWGQTGERESRVWRDYLAETTRRGIPLDGLFLGTVSAFTPRWSTLDKALSEAQTLEPGADVDLVAAWALVQEGHSDEALGLLKSHWPRPPLELFKTSLYGETLFKTWNFEDSENEWTAAWLNWGDKVYSPSSLVRGLEVFEKIDPSAVEPLLGQALRLYPEDRRFLPLLARHQDLRSDVSLLLARDRKLNTGWSAESLRVWLDRDPKTQTVLTQSGYSPDTIRQSLGNDYGPWLASASKSPPEDGEWTWDADRDGYPESLVVFQKGDLVTWSKVTSDGSVWNLSFSDGKPLTVTEFRGGGRWTLNFEAYPLVKDLEYQWGTSRQVFRFAPLSLEVPLWPSDRFRADPGRLPSVLAEQWMPLDAEALARKAVAVETWEGPVLLKRVLLYQGEVWMASEDTDRDGRFDSWSYFENGGLVSVYRQFSGNDPSDVRELYKKGELTQVQVRAHKGENVEFVLFPKEGVQIWDPHGDHRPLERLFIWPSGDNLTALVFSGSKMPWETMPVWEPRP